MQKRLIPGALRALQRHQDFAIFQFFLVNLPRTGKWAAETSGPCTACTSTFALRARPTGIRAARRDAALAQSVEHIIRNDGVTCSSHVSGTISLFPDIPDRLKFPCFWGTGWLSSAPVISAGAPKCVSKLWKETRFWQRKSDWGCWLASRMRRWRDRDGSQKHGNRGGGVARHAGQRGARGHCRNRPPVRHGQECGHLLCVG